MMQKKKRKKTYVKLNSFEIKVKILRFYCQSHNTGSQNYKKKGLNHWKKSNFEIEVKVLSQNKWKRVKILRLYTQNYKN